MNDREDYVGIENFLSRFNGVKRKRSNQWSAQSPLRRDRTASINITLKDDGSILFFDFGGGGFHETLAAIGLQPINLLPDHMRIAAVDRNRRRSTRPRVPSAAELDSIRFHATVVLIAASSLKKGKPLTDGDMDLLAEATDVINDVVARITGPSSS